MLKNSTRLSASLGLASVLVANGASPITNVRAAVAPASQVVISTDHSMSLPLGSEAGEGPYAVIVDRNPFGLRPVPRPVPAAVEDPATAVSDLKLTGITVLRSSRRAMFVLETPGRPIVNSGLLGEGERDVTITNLVVLRIDSQAGAVRVRLGANEFTLDFAKNGIKPPTGPPAKPPLLIPGSSPIWVPSRAIPSVQRMGVAPRRS